MKPVKPHLILTGLPVLFVLFAAFAGSCLVYASQDATQEGKPVPFTQLDPARSGPRRSFATDSGISKPLQVVIRDREAWLRMWKQINSKRFDKQPATPPEVDFSREMLIVVAMGQRSSGGFHIIVDGIYERDNRLEVVVKNSLPGKNCLVTTALTEPVDIVRLQKSDLSIVFRESNVARNCGP